MRVCSRSLAQFRRSLVETLRTALCHRFPPQFNKIVTFEFPDDVCYRFIAARLEAGQVVLDCVEYDRESGADLDDFLVLDEHETLDSLGTDDLDDIVDLYCAVECRGPLLLP